MLRPSYIQKNESCKIYPKYILQLFGYNHPMTKRSWFLSILIAILPALLTMIILGDFFGVKLVNFHPKIWNDQVGYWFWAKSFSAVGFNAGYNGWDEMVAPATFNPYGENGPFYQIIYGSIGKLVGWQTALPIYINMVLLSLALLIFIRATKFENAQILHVGASVLLLFPILLYLPLSSHETLNQVIAILLALLFYNLQKGETKGYLKIFFALFLFFASLIRLSWAVLFLPFFFMLVKGKFIKKTIISLALSAVLGYVSLRVSGYLLPPTGNIILELLRETGSAGIYPLLHHIKSQLENLLRPNYRMDLIVSVEAFSLGVWNLFYLLKLQKKKLPYSKLIESTPFFNSYNLFIPLGMGVVFYLTAGFHRIFIPHILISVLLLISEKKYRPVYLSLFIGVIFYTPFWTAYQNIPINYQPNSAEFLETQNALQKIIIFDENTANHWCNTLLLPIDRYNDYVTMLPAGIGASPIIAPQNLVYPLKSKYILLDDETLARGAYMKYFPMDDLKLDLLDSLPRAKIYYNNDSECPRK